MPHRRLRTLRAISRWSVGLLAPLCLACGDEGPGAPSEAASAQAGPNHEQGDRGGEPAEPDATSAQADSDDPVIVIGGDPGGQSGAGGTCEGPAPGDSLRTSVEFSTSDALAVLATEEQTELALWPFWGENAADRRMPMTVRINPLAEPREVPDSCGPSLDTPVEITFELPGTPPLELTTEVFTEHPGYAWASASLLPTVSEQLPGLPEPLPWEHVPTDPEDPDFWMLLYFTPEGSRGSLRAGEGFGCLVARWPADNPCSHAGVPLTEEALTRLGVSAVSERLIEAFDDLGPIALAWKDGRTESLQLGLEPSGREICGEPVVHVAQSIHGSTEVTIPLEASLASDSGQLDADLAVTATALVRPDGAWAPEIELSGSLIAPAGMLGGLGIAADTVIGLGLSARLDAWGPSARVSVSEVAVRDDLPPLDGVLTGRDELELECAGTTRTRLARTPTDDPGQAP